MAVRYYTDDCTYRLPQKRLTAAWLDRVAREEGYELGDVTYIFCSAARLLDMNRQFLGHDYYTDVITFDYSDRKGRPDRVGRYFHRCGNRCGQCTRIRRREADRNAPRGGARFAPSVRTEG